MVMAIGSMDNSKNVAGETRHKKAEVYYHSTSSWETKASYPFHETINSFEIIAHSDSFILFGGFHVDEQISTDFHETGTIAQFNPGSNEWTKLGELQTGRHGFGVIEVDTKYLVMGGFGEKSTEICELKNETIECTSREPTLNQFRYYPAMMMVASNYADNC